MTLRDTDPRVLRDWTGLPLSGHQIDAATAELEPGLIVAGAGTGKTTVMAARVTWLVGTGKVRPDEVLGLTFTTKAAGELSRRVRGAVSVARAARPVRTDDDGEAAISTYHSFANSLVTEFGSLVGAEPTSRVLSEAALRQLAMRVLCSTSHEFEGSVSTLQELAKNVVRLDSALAEHDVEPDDLMGADRELIDLMLGHPQQVIGNDIVATAQRRRDLAALVLELRAHKQQMMAVDFADQLRWASKLAQHHRMVGEQIRQRYRVVLLDEYQDTSVTQRRLMQSLFGDGHAVTAVGDPFQAIYGFRGASVRNIEDFPVHFPVVGPDGDRQPARRYELTENRRSRQDILDVANAISAPLRANTPFPPLVSAADRVFPTAFIHCAFLDSEQDEFAWVADQVLAVRDAGQEGEGRHSWGDITILMRAMTRVSPLRDALSARGIPVEVVGVEGLISLPEVVEVVSVLRLLHDPTANPDCARLLAGPRWRIGPRDLRALGARAADLAGGERRRRGLGIDDTLDEAVRGNDPADLVSLLDALDDLGEAAISAEGRERMREVSQELRGLRRHVGEPLADLVQRVLDTTGFEAELRAQPDHVGAPRLASVHAFITLASEFRDLDGRATLGSFLRFLSDAARFDASPEALVPTESSSVRIMSAHKAKGLEFPVVILPSLMEQTFPTRQTLDVWPTCPTAVPFSVRHEPPPAELAGFPPSAVPTATEAKAFRTAVRDFTDLEETRLAYVAVTRAETTLIASGSRWALNGAATPREPSRFLQTIRRQCEQGLGAVVHWSEESDHESNPHAESESFAWPRVDDPQRAEVRAWAAHEVRSRLGEVTTVEQCAVPVHDPGGIVADWDRDLSALLEEVSRDGALEREVRLPDSLSVTALQRLAADESAFVLSLVRPMPGQPSPAARRGTRFHAWVETLWGQQPLLGADDLPGAADADITSDDELRAIQETFLQMPYVAQTPVALEEPFALVIAGRVVPGRIDAVFEHKHPSGDPTLTRWEVVDWKTSRAPTSDPLQLAIYRLAWAQRMGVDASRVDAAFVYVRLGEVQRFGDSPGLQPLPDVGVIEALLTGA